MGGVSYLQIYPNYIVGPNHVDSYIVIYLCHYPRYLTVVFNHITITYGSHETASKYHEYPMKSP